jgi:hypothetical protein
MTSASPTTPPLSIGRQLLANTSCCDSGVGARGMLANKPLEWTGSAGRSTPR